MKWMKRKGGRKDIGLADARIVNHLMRLRKWMDQIAGLLQVKMNQLSFRKQKLLLAGFCLVFVCGSVCVIVESLKKRSYRYGVQPIHVSPLLKERDEHVALPMAELQRIHRFKIYIDSLNEYERKRLLNSRPRLMDTVNFLESLYQEEIKGK